MAFEQCWHLTGRTKSVGSVRGYRRDVGRKLGAIGSMLRTSTRSYLRNSSKGTWTHPIDKKQWPKTLFVASEQTATLLAAEAKALGIGVVRISEDQLLLFISEARQEFRERFS